MLEYQYESHEAFTCAFKKIFHIESIVKNIKDVKYEEMLGADHYSFIPSSSNDSKAVLMAKIANPEGFKGEYFRANVKNVFCNF